MTGLAAAAVLAGPPVGPAARASEPERQAATEVAGPGPELVIEVLRPGGEPLETLEAGDLEVRVGGRPVAVRSLEPVAGEWRIVLYLDQRLTDLLVFRTGAHELGRLAGALTSLGSVEVVLADEQARTAFPATRDPAALGEALSWIQVRESAYPTQVDLRQRFVERLGPDDPSLWVRADAGRRIAELAVELRGTVAAEEALLQEQRRLLVEWLGEQRGDGPRLLILVGEGFDARPESFYRQLLAEGPASEALAGLDVPEASPTLGELETALAVSGWTVAAFAPAGGSDPLLAETEEERRAREESRKVETTMQGGRLIDKTTVGVDPRKLLGRGDEEGAPPRARLLAPREPLGRLAAAAGGELVGEGEALEAFLARLPARLRVELEPLDPAPHEAEPVAVSVRGPAATVRSPGWIAGGTPRAVSAVRVERVLRSEEGPGELLVTAAAVGDREGAPDRLAVRVEGVVPAPATPVRVSVGVDRAAGGAEIRHYLLVGSAEPPVAVEPDGSLRVDLPVDLWRDPEAPVAVVAEELASGRWGAALAEEAAGPEVDLAESLILPAPKAIHLMSPRSAMVMGRTTFDAVVSQAQVARVDFFLDGRQVASSYSAPHSAILDLGKLPETHVIEAVAIDSEGRELDRDRLTVNEGTGSFRVRLKDPRGSGAARRTGPLVGQVEVEAEVRLPRGSRLERLDFYWKDELAGTRFAPPYRQALLVPPADPRGFVRVVGRLDDGTTTEDVLLLNSPGETERLDVELVELYVVVSDRQGRPIKGLPRERFTVFEEGRRQSLATFGDAGDLPLTVGLVIDSSASMFVKLPEVQAAAAGYLQGLEQRKDRAFVVGFGGEPRLARDTTSDLGQVRAGLYGLEPDGRTAIWKAVVYSLVQLQGVAGKKALIVYSDGADEDPDFSYRTALSFARRVGVPVYFIVSNDEIYRTGGRGLNVRGFMGRLEKLAGEVGGRVYLTRVNEDLSDIYLEIDEELRSQYLLGFYAGERGEGRWREIEVEVDQPGATARTIAGYFR